MSMSEDYDYAIHDGELTRFDHEDGSCSCGGHAVVRTNRKDSSQFYGCSNFPKCRNTAPVGNGHGFTGDGLMSGEDQLTAWAEAMTHDCGFK